MKQKDLPATEDSARRMRRLIQVGGLAAVLVILIAINLLLADGFQRTRRLAEQVNASYVVRAQIQTLLSLHQDVETGQRGFVVTGDARFLEPYRASRDRIGRELDKLKAMVGPASLIGADLAELRTLSDRKLQFTAQSVRLKEAGRGDEAVRLIAGGRGRALMDDIRAHIGDMDRIERRQLDDRTRKAQDARRATQFFAFALQGLLLLVLAASVWLIGRSMAAKRSALSRLQDLSTRQTAIFDAAKDGMMILSADGTIESLNPATTLLYGYAEDELVGRNVGLLFETPPQPGQIEIFLKRLQARRAGDLGRVQEFSGRRKDGTVFPNDVAVSAVRLADRVRYLAIIRDITDRKQIEQMKTEFVSTVSHELRTPLTSIAGSLGLLAGGAAGTLPERADRLIRIAHSNSERLIRLINDILDIEKIESGKMTFSLKRIQLPSLLEQAVQANRAFAADYGVELALDEVPASAVVIADEDRLMQVVTNLLSNAAKFSPKGECVRISVREHERRYRISIADRGSGIPEEFKHRIFSKFAQADSSDTRQKGGTGLGLSIVREIVTRLGGAVSFESNGEQGTVFHVDLPSAEQPTHRARKRAAADRSAAGWLPRILHVDDDPDMLRVVASAFEGLAEVHSTPSVLEAEAAIARHSFDAAILDIGMADGSGLDLIPFLNDADGRTNVVIFTAKDTDPSLALLADAVLTKSRASLGQLVETVTRLVRANDPAQQTPYEVQ
jgi:PAS domain S-box-containing protein